MLATWHFHIEISSKCTLQCPRCARQEVPDSLVNTELDLEFFKLFQDNENIDEVVETLFEKNYAICKVLDFRLYY